MHFSYLTLCISPSPRVSIYYETIRPSACCNRHLSVISYEIHCFLAQCNLLFSFLRLFLYLIFSFCLFMSSLSPPPPQIFPHHLFQLNSVPQLFHFYFICIFIPISIVQLLFLYLPTYLRCSRTPAIPPCCL